MLLSLALTLCLSPHPPSGAATGLQGFAVEGPPEHAPASPRWAIPAPPDPPLPRGPRRSDWGTPDDPVPSAPDSASRRTGKLSAPLR